MMKVNNILIFDFICCSLTLVEASIDVYSRNHLTGRYFYFNELTQYKLTLRRKFPFQYICKGTKLTLRAKQENDTFSPQFIQNLDQGWATIFVSAPHCSFISVSQATVQSKRQSQSQKICLRWPDMAGGPYAAPS